MMSGSVCPKLATLPTRKSPPGVEGEVWLAVHSILGLDHLLDLEADAKGLPAEIEREVVKVGAVEVALVPRC